MSKQVMIEIELEGGTKLSHCTGLLIHQEFGTPHSFEISLPYEIIEESKEIFFKNSHEKVMGKIIKIMIKPYDGETGEFIFKGIVTKVELKYDNDFNPFFRISGMSTDGLLNDGLQRRTFAGQTLKQIYEKVLGDYPQNILKRKLNLEKNPKIDYEVQYDETNFSFLKRLAQENGNWFYYSGVELLIGTAGDQTVDFHADGIQHYNMSISLIPSKFGVFNYNYLKNEETSGLSGDQNVKGIQEFAEFALSKSEDLFPGQDSIYATDLLNDGSELNDRIKMTKTMRAGGHVSFNGYGENCNLSLGTIASVIGIRFDDEGSSSNDNLGKYRVTSIKHIVDENGCYSNQFTAIPESFSVPPLQVQLVKPQVNLELAVVIDNDDPEKLGRVKIKFYWQNDEGESVWVRVATLYSGEGRGVLFTPEPGAQVIVGYQHGDPSQPVVIGSLYYKMDGEDYTSDENQLKKIQTRSGNLIFFDDRDQEERILISNEKKDGTAITLMFKENGSIELKTDGSLSLAGKDISITSETLKIKVEQTIEMESQKSTEIKSSQMKMKASASLDVSAQGAVKVEGASVDVEGQALINMKAGIIKLN